MRKLSILFICAGLLLSLAACSGQEDSSKAETSSDSSVNNSTEASTDVSSEKTSDISAALSELSVEDATFDSDKDYSDAVVAKYIDVSVLTDKTKKDILDKLEGDKLTFSVDADISIAKGMSIGFSATVAKEGENNYRKISFASQDSITVKTQDGTFTVDEKNKTIKAVPDESNEESDYQDSVTKQIMSYLLSSFGFDKLEYKQNGAEEYNGEALTYEEYSSSGDITIKLYYNESTPRYIVSTNGDLSSVITINSFDSTVDSSLFDLSGYSKI